MNIQQLKIDTDKFFRDPSILWPLRFILLLSTIMTGLLLFKWNRLPPLLPFFYSLPWGEEQLVSPNSVIYLFLCTLAVIIINNLIGLLLYKKYLYYSRIIIISTAGLYFLLIFTVIKIVLLVS